MPNNLVDISIVGIKCDADGCDYKDDDVKFEDYEQYLNKPCPKCGESLLTPEDLTTAKQMMEMAEMLNSFGADLPPELLEEGERVSVELNMKGDGSVELGEFKKDDTNAK